MKQNKSSLLKVSNLAVSFDTVDGPVQAVQGIDFDLNKGQTLAIIGESGSGKSVTASVIMGILTCPPGRVKSGEIFLDGEDILKLSDNKRRKLMGNKIAIIFQDTLSHLNPVFSVGKQISECFEVHNNFSRQESWNRAVKLLDRVKIPNPSKRALSNPSAFAAIALPTNPPTLDAISSALDNFASSYIGIITEYISRVAVFLSVFKLVEGVTVFSAVAATSALVSVLVPLLYAMNVT